MSDKKQAQVSNEVADPSEKKLDQIMDLLGVMMERLQAVEAKQDSKVSPTADGSVEIPDGAEMDIWGIDSVLPKLEPSHPGWIVRYAQKTHKLMKWLGRGWQLHPKAREFESLLPDLVPIEAPPNLPSIVMAKARRQHERELRNPKAGLGHKTQVVGPGVTAFTTSEIVGEVRR